MRVWGQPVSTLESIHCGLLNLPGQITAGCFTSRPAGMVTVLMYGLLYFRVNHCGLLYFPGQSLRGVFTSRLSNKVTGLMYVPSTRLTLLLRNCSLWWVLHQPLERYAEKLNSSIWATIEMKHNTRARRLIFYHAPTTKTRIINLMEDYRTKRKRKKARPSRFSPVHPKNNSPKVRCRSQQKSNSQLATAKRLPRTPLLGLIDNCVDQLGEDKTCYRRGEDVAQLALGQGMVNDELLVDDPVAQPHEPTREVLASTAVDSLPR